MSDREFGRPAVGDGELRRTLEVGDREFGGQRVGDDQRRDVVDELERGLVVDISGFRSFQQKRGRDRDRIPGIGGERFVFEQGGEDLQAREQVGCGRCRGRSG